VTRVAVLGYVNLDHVVGLTRDVEAGTTALVAHRHTPSGGRVGGCPSYIATGLAQAGIDAAVVSTVGNDTAGATIQRALREAGVDTRGLRRDPSLRTGVSWLPHAPSGATYCIYDPGGELPAQLDQAQRRVCSAADWLVAAAGPPGPCAEALDLLAPSARVFWAVKGDPLSFPQSLADALAARAAAIVYSATEADFLADLLGADGPHRRRDALVVETHGADGARFWADGKEQRTPPEAPLPVSDTIGAGDRFCAGLLAALIGGATGPDAVQAGADAAQALLRERLDRTSTTNEERRNADAETRVVPAGDA